MRFNTRKYRNVHGKLPRGKGAWAFGLSDNSVLYLSKGPLSYTEAKKEAAEFLKGIPEVYVLP